MAICILGAGLVSGGWPPLPQGAPPQTGRGPPHAPLIARSSSLPKLTFLISAYRDIDLYSNSKASSSFASILVIRLELSQDLSSLRIRFNLNIF